MDISVVINQVLMLFLPIVLGFFIIKAKIVDSNFNKNISSFLFNITLPCTIVSAMQFDFDKGMLLKSATILIISVITVFISWAFSALVAKLLRMRGDEKGLTLYSLSFSNYSFMGYPVAQAFMGPTGLFYATIFSLPYYALIQSLGIAFVSGGEGEKGFKLRYIINPPMVAVFIGFILFLTGFRFPTAIDGTINSLGSMTTPLAMVLVGLSLASHPLKNAFTDFKYYIISVLRLVVLPLAFFYVLQLIGIPIEICRITAIILMMPVAANVIIVLASMGRDASCASKAVLLSTLLSIITIPLMGQIIF